MIFNPKPLLKPILLALLISIVLCNAGCEKQQSNSTATTTQSQIITATLQSNSLHLFYSGTLQPLKIYNVTSPVDGVVDELYFNYGDRVTSGQLLMKITSTKSQQDYATALTNYIKDKDQYLQNKTNFEGTTALFKAGIVDREDYLSQKSQLGASELAYINSNNALKAIVSKIPGAPRNIENLTLHDIAAIEKMLQTQYDKFTIQAPTTGIVLTADRNAGSNTGDGNKTLAVGSEIKQNQTAVSIGDMSGISVTINVSEIDINHIALDQTAVLTSPALPGMLLYGKVIAIGKQAKTPEGGGIANFPVIINVPEITPLQRELVKVGMSIKVDLTINNPAQIKIPIKAVFFLQGVPTVTIIDPKSGKPRNVTVITGTTDIDNVTILQGLSVGDKIIISGDKQAPP
ncbi:MAG TPA: efflux RND transporter periplasmic adaptor subunit [Gammaproteobacteria bacterium]|nr:efflux RND transporter periplasmic adaptor subunit [Gammaproteobacteria bacterium]